MNFLTALGLTLIVLKLTNNIDWDWYLVLLPIYGGLLLFVIGVVFVIVATEIKEFYERRK